MNSHQVGEVFTPSSIAALTFVERNGINEELVDALRTKGKQLVVYGHSGCGKTTLLENKLRQVFSRHIRTSCMKGMTFEQILADPLRQLNAMYQSEHQSTTSQAITGTLSSGTFVPPSVSLQIGATDVTGLKKVPIVPMTPTAHVVAEMLGANNACWVLEDFHKVDPSEKEKLAQCMKMFMDLSDRYPDLKLIFIGAVNSAREVLQYDPELRHRVSEVHVPLMTEDELREIVSLGEECLNITFDHRITERIIVISNGLAAVCHQLALHFCNVRGIEFTQSKRLILDTGGWLTAVERYLKDSSDTLKAAFEKSVKNMKKRKYDHGRLILRALTKLPQAGACQADILSTIRQFEPNYPASGLAANLRALQSEERGATVTYDDTAGLFSFSEPVHRAFCHSIFESEDKVKPSRKHGDEIEVLLRQLIPELAARLAKSDSKRNGR